MTFLVANKLMDEAAPKDDPFGAPSSDPFSANLEAAIVNEVEALIACAEALDSTMLVVSNEVGMGLVPPYVLGRAYRDILGRANQILARHADEVYFLVAGLPMQMK